MIRSETQVGVRREGTGLAALSGNFKGEKKKRAGFREGENGVLCERRNSDLPKTRQTRGRENRTSCQAVES